MSDLGLSIQILIPLISCNMTSLANLRLLSNDLQWRCRLLNYDYSSAALLIAINLLNTWARGLENYDFGNFDGFD
jgi:hypothetical protein